MSINNNNIDIRETHIIGKETREWIVSSSLCPALQHHDISLVGLTEADSDFHFTRSDPQWSQIIACTEGFGWVWLENQWAPCQSGQIYVTPPHVFHAYHSDARSPWKLCWVQSSGDWLHLGERPRLLSADPGPLSEVISGVHREVMQSAETTLLPPWAFLVYSYALRLVRPGSGDPRLWFLWEQVGEDLAAPWTVEKLARLIGFSPEHLRRLCKTHLAMSPMRHVTALRMRRASALLASESYTVEAVAHLVGYDNPYAFSTAFKRQVGMPPSEYRQGNVRGTANKGIGMLNENPFPD